MMGGNDHRDDDHKDRKDDDPHGQTVIIPTGSVWGDILERFTSRKFLLTVFVETVGAIGFLHTHVMDGGTFVALSTLVLSSYSAASIADKRYNGG
jgi:hypothetical protein